MAKIKHINLEYDGSNSYKDIPVETDKEFVFNAENYPIPESYFMFHLNRTGETDLINGSNELIGDMTFTLKLADDETITRTITSGSTVDHVGSEIDITRSNDDIDADDYETDTGKTNLSSQLYTDVGNVSGGPELIKFVKATSLVEWEDDSGLTDNSPGLTWDDGGGDDLITTGGVLIVPNFADIIDLNYIGPFRGISVSYPDSWTDFQVVGVKVITKKTTCIIGGVEYTWNSKEYYLVNIYCS